MSISFPTRLIQCSSIHFIKMDQCWWKCDVKMKQTVPLVIDRDAVVVERIDNWPEVIDHVSRECPLPVSISEAGRSEVLVMVPVSDQVMGCHVSLMAVHIVGRPPFLTLDGSWCSHTHCPPHLDVLPLVVPVIVPVVIPVLLISVQGLISVTTEFLAASHLRWLIGDHLTLCIEMVIALAPWWSNAPQQTRELWPRSRGSCRLWTSPGPWHNEPDEGKDPLITKTKNCVKICIILHKKLSSEE